MNQPGRGRGKVKKKKVNGTESFLAQSHCVTEGRKKKKSTFTSKLLELFSATLGQRAAFELASPAANSAADMQHRASHSPPTLGPRYRTTAAVNSAP